MIAGILQQASRRVNLSAGENSPLPVHRSAASGSALCHDDVSKLLDQPLGIGQEKRSHLPDQ